MTTIINSFSVRADPAHVISADNAVVRSFAARLQERHDVSGTAVVTARFNAGVLVRHLPRGEAEAIRSFAVVPSGYDLAGVALPDHETIDTDVLRYHSNG